MCPDLPMPVTMTRPLAEARRSTAAVKASPREPSRAFMRTAMPSRSVPSVRRADATASAAGSGFLFGIAMGAVYHGRCPGATLRAPVTPR
jgi:hypothetical protein